MDYHNIERKDVIPVVNRKITNLYTKNIFGGLSPKMKFCSCCGVEKPIIDYYVKENRQHILDENLKQTDFRYDCIICYDEKNKNNKYGFGWKTTEKVLDKLKSNNLSKFLCDEVDNA